MIPNIRTLRVQTYVAIALTLACIAIIYSLILFPFENARLFTIVASMAGLLNVFLTRFVLRCGNARAGDADGSGRSSWRASAPPI